MQKPLAISMGEPAGIGPDLILALYTGREVHDLAPFCVFGDAAFLRSRAKRLGLEIELETAAPSRVAEVFARALPVMQVGDGIDDRPGALNPATGNLVIASIEQAVAAILAGGCRALVTAPINKAALYEAGFAHPGHTEFLAALCARDGIEPHPVMMLAHGELRAVPLTVHVPLKDVPGLVTREAIIETLRVVDRDLRDRFAIPRPKIAIAGLNPHAGERGSIGREDAEIIAPALRMLADEIDVAGPLPADTLFYPPHWRHYDAIVAMYHDQALIPIKTVAFEDAVNVTLGLPIVRTSPDHGTALDLAGTGKASPKSFLAAIRMADQMTRPGAP